MSGKKSSSYSNPYSPLSYYSDYHPYSDLFFSFSSCITSLSRTLPYPTTNPTLLLLWLRDAQPYSDYHPYAPSTLTPPPSLTPTPTLPLLWLPAILSPILLKSQNKSFLLQSLSVSDGAWTKQHNSLYF